MHVLIPSLIVMLSAVLSVEASTVQASGTPNEEPGLGLSGWQVALGRDESPMEHEPSRLRKGRANLEVREVQLSEALMKLSRRSEIAIFFSPTLLPARTVSCDCAEVSVGEALARLVAGTNLEVREFQRQVIVAPAPAAYGTDRAPAPARDLVTRVPPQVASPPLSLSAIYRPVSTVARQGTITGLIRDQQTGTPLSFVQVSIPQLEVGTVSQDNGRYLLENVPAGTYTLAVARLGFRAETAVVTVTDGETTVQDFFLSPQMLQLEQIVATGTAAGARVREIGNAVSRLDGSVAELQPIANVSSLIRGRVAGVAIQQGSGAVGTASAIKIRGSSTMRLVNDGPLIYIDGVRVNNEMRNIATDVSRIDDLDPTMIESIEVVKGPAAATLYGTEAANGVIQIITKGGGIGATQWNFTTRQGANWFHDPAGRTPTNWGVNPSTGQVESFNILQNKEERDLMFRTGRVQYYGTDVSGGTGSFRYFAGGSVDSQQGATPNSWAKRYNGRLNVNAAPTDRITIAANTGFVLNRLRLPGAGSYIDAVQATPAHLEGPRRGYRTAPPEARYYREHTYNDVNRITAGVTVAHDPLPGFTHRLTFGLDATDDVVTNLNNPLPPEFAQFFSERAASGSKTVTRRSSLLANLDYGASASRPLTDNLASVTSVGMQVYTSSRNQTGVTGTVFPVLGLSSVSSASERTGTETFVENNTVGVYLQQQLGWHDRRFITVAVRADDNSAFGDEFTLVYYPKVSGSWVLSDEDFWGLDFLPSFRVRAAFGQSGQQPDAFDSFRTFSTRASPDGPATVFPSAPGNAELGPEVGQEIEAGFDAQLFNDRLSVEVTFYDQRTKNAIVARDVAPSGGFLSNQFINIGEVSNRGVEIGLNAQVLDRGALQWDLGLNISTNRNRIEELGLEGFLGLGWVSRHAEGYPVGSLWAPKVIEATLDPDGQVRDFRCDNGQGVPVTCNEDAWLYQGHPDPNVEGAVTSALSLGGRFTFQALVHGKIGQHKYDLMQWWRYSAYNVTELNHFPEKFDPRDVAEAQYGNTGEFALWLQDASFVRLRELSLIHTLPNTLASRVGADRGQISLAVQNPFGGILWTRWPNPQHDPETVDPSNTFSGNREPQNHGHIPPLTSVAFTVRLGY